MPTESRITVVVRSLAPLAACAVLAACGSDSTAPASTPAPATVTPTPSTSTATVTETATPSDTESPSSSVSSTPDTSGGSGGNSGNDCADGQLAVSGVSAGGAGGHSGMILRFRNTSSDTCSLFGYPGAAVLDASGVQFEQAKRTTGGYLGQTSEKRITVAPGATASAVIEGAAQSSEHPSGRGCDRGEGLLVTPPNTKKSTRLEFHAYSCDVEIHPVVAGSKGGIG